MKKSAKYIGSYLWSLLLFCIVYKIKVFAGATLGLVLGAGWFWIVNTMLVEYFPAIEESAIGRWLYIKDTSHIPNVLEFEYDNARAARKKVATD
jgi:dolichyldiphosphatase